MNNKEELVDYSIYKIFKDGRVFSILKDRFLEDTLTSDGYVQNKLMCKDGVSRFIRRNRLIWFYFNGEIPEGMVVNHIDENKENNSITNMNLMTIEQNNKWGTRGKRARVSISKAKKGIIPKANPPKEVYQFSLDGELIKVWSSASELGRNGFNQGWVSQCCRESKPAYGYIWKYHLT